MFLYIFNKGLLNNQLYLIYILILHSGFNLIIITRSKSITCSIYVIYQAISGHIRLVRALTYYLYTCNTAVHLAPTFEITQALIAAYADINALNTKKKMPLCCHVANEKVLATAQSVPSGCGCKHKCKGF